MRITACLLPVVLSWLLAVGASAHPREPETEAVVFGRWVRSPLLLEMLDLHGHDVDPNQMPCTTCRALYETGGFCEDSKLGFDGQRAFVSALAYGLTVSRTPEAACARTACPPDAWCTACAHGHLGDRVVRDRTTWQRSATALAVLDAALAELSRCTHCAVAILGNARCPDCNRTYAGGKLLAPIQGTAP